MDPEKWARVREVFDRVVEADSGERAALLAELAGEDAELRREVESLLGAAARADSFLEAPLVAEALALQEPPPPPPERIGAYRVLAEIGSGGMGTVYEAVREDFPKTVALKVVRSNLDGALVRRRFRQERAILAGLEHPAIARLYDGGTTDDGRPYLVMERVRGLPLLEHADGRGLSVTARIELFLEVCAAVAFAHERGIVHRDLKPSNVLVDEAGQPKLLDFGVAKLLEPASDEREPTLTAAPLMTPEYASPEQVRGEPVGPASDVYSLGVVLYELLTGQRPYRLASRAPREVERAVCETEPERPSTAVSRVEEIEREGSPVRLEPEIVGRARESTPDKLRCRLRGDLDAVLLKALRKDPSQRYAAVTELAADLRRHLDGQPVLARRGSWRYRAGKLLRRHRAATAALALGAIALGVGFLLARLRYPPSPQRPPRTVAVLGFTNLGNRPADGWIGAVLGEMLRTELGASQELSPIPAESVAQARRDLRLVEAQTFGAETLRSLYRRLGSDLVVAGSYLAGPAADSPLRVDVRVQRAPGGEVVAEIAETATPADLLRLVARAGFALRSRLELEALSPAQAQELVASRPADREAARLYAEGVRALHEYEIAKARALLEAAIAKAPEFAPAHAELAEVLSRQGYEAQAAAVLDRAAGLAGSLPTRERLRIAGLQAQWSGDREGAIAAYRELVSLDPHDLDAGLSLGLAQVSARLVPDALATLATLRKLPGPLGDDPRIDMLEARAARGSPAGNAAAERAAAKAQALSANLLLARARFAAGAQHWDSPDIARVIPFFEEALSLWTAGGAKAEAGNARIQIGLARWRAGEVEAGEAEVEEVLATVPATELPGLRYDALDFLAAMVGYRGELGRARACHEEAALLARELGAIESELSHRGSLGTLDYLAGDPAAGRRALVEALGALRARQAEFYREDVALALGWLLAETGDLEGAARLARESEPEAPGALHEHLWSAESLWLQGTVLAARGELGAAREKLEAARRLLDATSMRHQAAEIVLSLAALALAEGKSAEAVSLARVGVAHHRTWSELSWLVPSASAVLARALLAEGRVAEAAAAFESVGLAAARSESALHRLEVAIDGARLRAAQGDARAAAEELRRIVADAERIGYVSTALSARLALGEALLLADPGRARQELRSLAAEARAKGFALITLQARELLGGSSG